MRVVVARVQNVGPFQIPMKWPEKAGVGVGGGVNETAGAMPPTLYIKKPARYIIYMFPLTAN